MSSPPPPPLPPTRRSGRLLERHSELASIDLVVPAALGGDGRLLLVEGPAGIGKTRLVAEARSRAGEAGMRVLSARGSELERDFSFGVVRQLFEALLVDAAAAAGPLLAGSAAAARPVVAPLGEAADMPADASFAALHGLYWLCVNLTAEGPLALVVDDLHWCDRPSLRFLDYMVRRLDGLPLLVVGSLRPSEPGADATILAELARDPATVALRPDPLTPEAARELIGARLGTAPDERFAEACHKATGGNPLLLTELLAALEAENVAPDAERVSAVSSTLGPRAVSRSVLARLGRLSGGAVAAARAAAVLGDSADPRRVAELAGLDDATAERATAELVRAEILRPEPPVGFVHPLVRAAIYHDVTPPVRERQHARAARVLAAAGAPEEQVAAQLLVAPPSGEEWVVDALAGAARTALGRGGADSTVAYVERALREPPDPARRPELLLEAGAAAYSLNGPAAAGFLRACYDEAEDPVLRARAAHLLTEVLYLTGAPSEGCAIATRAAACLGPREPDLAAQLEALRATAAFFDPRVLPLDAPEFHSLRRPRDDGIGARMISGVAAYHWAMTGGSAAECVPLALHCVGGGAMRRFDASGSPRMAGLIVLIVADHPGGEAAARELLGASHETGSLFLATGGYIFAGLLALATGDLEEADRLERLAREAQEVWGQVNVRLFPAAYHAEVLIEKGDLAGAREALAWAGMPADDELPDSSNVSWWLAARLRYLVAAGALDEALALADDCERRFASTVVNPAWVPWRSLRAVALHRLGREEEAVEAARSEVATARAWGAPRALGRALRVLGEVAADREVTEEAVAVLEDSPARLELAKALAAVGRMLRQERRPTEARDPLGRALDLAVACEAAPLADHVRAEIHATGIRPRTSAHAGSGALTPSERRVAGMAVEGASNKDIAQALYVTPKTIEVHLSSAYRKLGIRSRRELAGALAA